MTKAEAWAKVKGCLMDALDFDEADELIKTLESGHETALDIIHKTIYNFFDVCGDDEEQPMSDKDKLLLEINKAICTNLKAGSLSEFKDKTLGDMFELLLPNATFYHGRESVGVSLGTNRAVIQFTNDWWNKPYSEVIAIKNTR